MNKSFIAAALLSTALTSCAVGPDYEMPQLDLNEAWNLVSNPSVQKPMGAKTGEALKVKVQGKSCPLGDIEKLKNKNTADAPKPAPVKAEEKKADVKPEESKPAEKLPEAALKAPTKDEQEREVTILSTAKTPKVEARSIEVKEATATEEKKETVEIASTAPSEPVKKEVIKPAENPNWWDEVSSIFSGDKAPEAKADEEKKETATADNKQAGDVFEKSAWWENFNDPTLNELIKEAEKENRDLRIAQARVKEARANRLGSLAVLLPQVNASGSADRSKQNSMFTAKPINSYQVGFDALWEIDIFGGNRRRMEAADALVGMAKADEKDVLISLRAEVARNYVELRNYQNQIRITEDNIKSQSESFNLTKSQRDAGLVSDLDVSQAESLYFATSSRLPLLKTSLEESKNNLSILLGKQPGALDAQLGKPGKVPVADRKFLISTPAQAIASRPDVKSAERNLAAATALQGAAFAELFPKISLSGFFGYADSTLVKGGSVWSIGGNALMPLLDFGRVRAGIRVADAQAEQALNFYEQTILTSLGEIQTALVAYINEENRRISLEQAVASNQKAVNLSKQRYDSGVSAFTDVLVAQTALYERQSQLAESEASVARNLIALNKAIGR